MQIDKARKLLFLSSDDCETGSVNELQPGVHRAKPGTVDLLKSRLPGVRNVVFDEDETPVCEAVPKTPKDRYELVVAQLTEYPLAPDGVIAVGLRYKLDGVGVDIAQQFRRDGGQVASRRLQEGGVDVDQVDLVEQRQKHGLRHATDAAADIKSSPWPRHTASS